MRCLVTGANGGIGRALVAALVARGHTVRATDVCDGELPAGVTVHRLDVTSAEDWAQAEAFEPDVLFNVAGVARAGAFVDQPVESIAWHFDVNVKGAALGMRTVLPGMVSRGRGHVVNVGSLAGVAPVPGIALYSASKFALRGLSLATATELRGTGVAVSIVGPDLVDTEMIEAQKSQPKAAYSFSGGRVLSPQAVATYLATTVLDERPLEALLPRHRGVLVKAVGAAPRIAHVLAPWLRRKGLARQAEMRGGA